MHETTPIELRYSGTEVEEGTVPVADMVDALVGFAGAFSKVARKHETSPEAGHRIRVVGLQKGSAKILLDAVHWTVQNPVAAGVLVAGAGVAVNATSNAVSGAYTFIKDIAGVIRGKKALKGQPITDDSYTFNNHGFIILQGVELTKEQFEYLKSGELDPDLDKLTAPLENGRGADGFELKSGEEELVKVTKEDRPYFVHTEVEFTTTKDDVWLEGTLYSHSKRSNRGMFLTLSGKRIPYHYAGKDTKPLLTGYAYNGTVRILGRVTFNAELDPIYIEIHEVVLKQDTMFEPKELEL